MALGVHGSELSMVPGRLGGTELQVKYHIWYNIMSNTTCSSRCTLMCAARPNLVGWATSDGVAHILSYGTWGYIPHS
jgi:hypothetical protein